MILQKVKSWLIEAYMSKLGIELSDNAMSASPVLWKQDSPNTDCADLLDRELGVWTRFASLQVGRIDATSSDQVNKLVKENIQWALRSVSTLTPRIGIEPHSTDENGGWSICLCFILPQALEDIWCRTIGELREESGFSEEVAIDARFFAQLEAIDKDITASGGLPHLLLNTRRLLAMSDKEVPTWLSVDAQVTELLINLPSTFADVATRDSADALVSAVLSSKSEKVLPAARKAPDRYSHLKVQNFRNIQEIDLDLLGPEEIVATRVVFGPNGTGKSSLFEALSLAVSGTSRGLEEFFDDRDYPAATAKKYLESVISPLRVEQDLEKPQVYLDGLETLQRLSTSKEEANQRRANSDGSLLSQEEALSFVSESSSSRGARVLADYSDVAQRALAYADRELSLANSQRQDWLRKFGLTANITRASTRQHKLCEYFIDRMVPRSTQQLTDWLFSAATLIRNRKEELSNLHDTWVAADVAGRSRLIHQISEAFESSSAPELQRILVDWLSSRQQILMRIRSVYSELKPQISEQETALITLKEELTAWSNWLKRPTEPQQSFLENQRVLSERLRSLSEALEAILDQSKPLRIRVEHLSEVQVRILPAWTAHDQTHCPTCNTNHPQPGGIQVVIEETLSKATKALEALFQEQQVVQKQIEAARLEWTNLGQCPVSEARRAEIAFMLGFEQQDISSIERRLLDTEGISDILRSVRSFVIPFELPPLKDPKEVAEELSRAISSESRHGELLWVLPERWSSIRKAINESAMKMVQQHIPQTLEMVWFELAMSLTAARWNIAASPEMRAETKKGAESLRLVASNGNREVSAKYFFNQAEQHVLGLAWFFLRYLSSGRFAHQLIALDDPAQDMDQTTFRSFTRFVQQFVRLHRVKRIPVCVIVLLHQEDRALDLARATNHQLTTISWSKWIKAKSPNEPSLTQLALLSTDFRFPLPRALVTSAKVN